MDSMSSGPTLFTEQTAAAALIKTGHDTHVSTEQAARTRLGFLRLTKGGQAGLDSDRVITELAHVSFCRPRPTAVSGQQAELRQAFVDRTLEVSMQAGSKATCGAGFEKATPYKPPGQDAKAKKAAADKRKAASAAAAAAIATGTEPCDGS
jgi:hypothetical protein